MESGAHLLLSAEVIISSACLTVLFLSLKIKKLKKLKKNHFLCESSNQTIQLRINLFMLPGTASVKISRQQCMVGLWVGLTSCCNCSSVKTQMYFWGYIRGVRLCRELLCVV